MFKHIFKTIKNERGQAVVELAITLPILIIILCGIIDFGWLFTNQNIIDFCAREGARYAVVHSTDADALEKIEQHTRNSAPANIKDDIIIGISFSHPYDKRSGDVTITVSNSVNILTPIAGIFINGQQMELTSSCVMKVE